MGLRRREVRHGGRPGGSTQVELLRLGRLARRRGGLVVRSKETSRVAAVLGGSTRVTTKWRTSPGGISGSAGMASFTATTLPEALAAAISAGEVSSVRYSTISGSKGGRPGVAACAAMMRSR